MSPQKEVFVVVGNMQRVPVRFWNWTNPNFHDLDPIELNDINPKDTGNFVVIFTDYQKDEIIKNIRSKFPEMKLEEHRDEFGFTFYTLTSR